MAPTAAPPATGDGPKHVVKDAMFLFELFRESPVPILIHIGPYAAKTGAKPNTIIKRLGEIKKRNNLNIVTTNAASGGTTGDSNVKTPSSGGKGTPGTGDSNPKVKREKKATANPTNPKKIKLDAPDTPSQQLMTENGDIAGTIPNYMGQKRALADDDEDGKDEVKVAVKKIKHAPGEG